MDETRFTEHDYFGQTTLHPLALLVILLAAAAIMIVPRRWAVVPLFVVGCFVAPAQRVVIASLDFNLLRLMVVFGWARVFTRAEFKGIRWQRLDAAMVLWAVSGTVAYTALHGEASALIFKLGASFDALGMYFLFRCLLRGWEDMDKAVLALIVISVPVSCAFLFEAATATNLFAFFGGVPPTTMVRDGRLRCQGAFAHAILAGCFWAAVMPLMAARWWRGHGGKTSTVVGLGCCSLIIVACASSTPVLGVLVGMIGAAMFVLRRRLRWVRWGIVAVLVGLHMVMKAPVWNLIARVNVVGGSTGYHRYMLIDNAVRHFSEWWLLGTKSTAHWGWLMYDVTNQYLLEGVRGGLFTMILFIAVIAVAFGRVGSAWRAAGTDTKRVSFAWAVGVALLVHVTAFISISYFGQIIMIWYLTLAMAACLPTRAAKPNGHAERRPIARAAILGDPATTLGGPRHSEPLLHHSAMP
jgi:hypothetical protein